MKNEITLKSRAARVLLVLSMAFYMAAVYVAPVYASGIKSQITKGIGDLKGILIAIVTGVGVLVAIIGGVNMALGYKNQQPPEMRKGLLGLIAGVGLALITQLIGLFGLS